MPEMYQVFSMHRAGRPRWAAVATGIVFVATTIAAALVSAHKSRQTEVMLGEPRAYRQMSMRVSLPAGWDVQGPERVGAGHVLLASPAAGQAGGRVLVFRLRPPAILLDRSAALRGVLLGVLESVYSDAEVLPQFQGVGTLGDLESELYVLGTRGLAPGSGVRAGLANIAMTSDRQIVGVLMLADGEPTGRDRRLLLEICKALSYEPLPDASEEQPGRPRGLIREPRDVDRTVPKPLV